MVHNAMAQVRNPVIDLATQARWPYPQGYPGPRFLLLVLNHHLRCLRSWSWCFCISAIRRTREIVVDVQQPYTFRMWQWSCTISAHITLGRIWLMAIPSFKGGQKISSNMTIYAYTLLNLGWGTVLLLEERRVSWIMNNN